MVVHPARAVNPHTPIAMDAMADADDARQPLHIDVHELARMRPLIAAHHRRRLESSWRYDEASLGAPLGRNGTCGNAAELPLAVWSDRVLLVIHRIAQQPKIRVGRHSRTSHRAPIVASHRNSIALGPRLERLRHLCSVGSPAHRGETTAVWRGTSLRFVAAPAFAKATARSRRSSLEILRAEAEKNDSSARALTMTAAADVIRATVHNRVDNQRPTR